jgi:hypothetical protein
MKNLCKLHLCTLLILSLYACKGKKNESIVIPSSPALFDLNFAKQDSAKNHALIFFKNKSEISQISLR